MKKLWFLLLLLLIPARGNAQQAVIGASCPASGQNAISNTGVPVVCTQPPGGGALVWTAVGGGSSGGGGSGALGSPGCAATSTTCIDPTNATYGAKFDAQVVFDASWTSTGTLVTCSTNDCNFVAARDNSKSCWGVDASGVFTFGNSLGVLTVVTAQTANCVTGTGAASTQTATGSFAWGTNDTAAITAATTALYALPHCGVLQMPSGHTILAAGVGVNPIAPATCTTQGVSSAGYYYSGMRGSLNVQGQGRAATIIHPAPGFNFATCSSGGGNGCFWSGAGSTFMGFSIDGLGASLTGITTVGSNNFLWVPGSTTGGRIQDVYLYNWAYSATDTPKGVSLGGQSIPVSNLEVAKFGVGGGIINCGNNTILLGTYAAGGLIVANSIICIDNDGAYGNNGTNNIDSILIAAGGQMQAYGMYTQEGGTGADAINVGGTLYCNECAFNVNPASVSSIGIKMTGGIAYLRNTEVSGGSTAGAISGTGTVVNEGGNCASFSPNPCTASTSGPFTFTGTYVDLTGTFPTAGCTGVATSSQATIAIKISGQTAAGAGVPSTCTGTTADAGIMMQKAGTILELLATASAAGSTAGSGLITILKNGVASARTCTLGTTTACTDGIVANQVTVAKGDLISATFATGAAETLANVQVSLVIW